jgi:hypothetical protein
VGEALRSSCYNNVGHGPEYLIRFSDTRSGLKGMDNFIEQKVTEYQKLVSPDEIIYSHQWMFFLQIPISLFFLSLLERNTKNVNSFYLERSG